MTLTGAGGIGKTRLAVETARRMPLPSVFVPLADLPDPERVPEATLQALIILSQPNVDPVEQLIAVLQVRDSLLLILDNAEHLLASVSAIYAAKPEDFQKATIHIHRAASAASHLRIGVLPIK